MSEKVKLPREVAEALDELRLKSIYPIRVAMDIIYGDECGGDQVAIKQFCESDRSRRVEYIACALVNGYEVEETPEDKVKFLFQKHLENQQTSFGDTRESKTICTTIHFVLDTLNIKIDGVNT